MVQAGAVMTTQKRKELTYVPRLENPVSSTPFLRLQEAERYVREVATRLAAGEGREWSHHIVPWERVTDPVFTLPVSLVPIE